MNNSKNYLVAVGIVVLILLVGGMIWYSKIPKVVPNNNDVNQENFKPAPGVEVNFNDTSKPEGKVAPSGLPINLPINGDIVESYKAYYSEMAATQYTVSMNSNESKSTILNEITTFLSKNNFTIDAKASNKAAGQISATSGKDTLNIVVSTINGKSFVQINYLDR